MGLALIILIIYGLSPHNINSVDYGHSPYNDNSLWPYNLVVLYACIIVD